MHGDEANQAVRTGLLLEQGVYHYDPADHHGPVLYYAALPFCRLTSSRFADTTEIHFRLVPVIFSLLTLLLVAGLYRRDGTGLFRNPVSVSFAILLIAVSPAMNYYSRFFIQETMFVTFLTGMLVCAVHYVRAPSSRLKWLCAGGVGGFAGLALATKETVVLSMLAGLVAFLVACDWGKFRSSWSTRDFLVMLGMAGGVATLFYSSFFTYFQGVYDAVFLTVKTYMTRATGVPEHQHAWDFYLKMLFGWKYGRGPVWRELNLLLLIPLAAAFIAPVVECVRSRTAHGSAYASGVRARWTLFLLVYTVVLTFLYACIPYKTPWCILSFLIGYLLLMAKGVEYLFEWLAPFKTSLTAMILSRLVCLALIVCCCLAVERNVRRSVLACFTYAADIRNPYVYAHTGQDALNLVKAVEEAAAKRMGGQGRMHEAAIAIAAPPSDYWPLPWYLRKYKQVGYWASVTDIPTGFKPDILIVSSDQGDNVSSLMGADVQSTFYGIRPGTLLLLFVNN